MYILYVFMYVCMHVFNFYNHASQSMTGLTIKKKIHITIKMLKHFETVETIEMAKINIHSS